MPAGRFAGILWGMDASPKRRWFHPTPGWLVVALLVVEAVLWLSNWLEWPHWHKGYAVLTAVAALGFVIIVMPLWLLAGLLFRWRFQFGIRTLLLMTVAVAVPCSWMTVEMKRAREQQSARTAFRRFPGGVIYDYEFSEPRTKSPAPNWLCRLLGDDFFAHVATVCLGCNKRFTDADMAYVESLPRLKRLTLGNANVTDVGLQHLAVLTELEHLTLASSQVDDDGLEYLTGLTQLHILGLSYTKVTDAGLKHINRLSKLETLYLGKTKVSDAGLKHLKGLDKLKTLDLRETQVTDAGLEDLKGLTQLTSLVVYGTQVTSVGVAKLQQTLPNCQITN